MTEIKQLRKEVNELGERLAQLEDRVNPLGPGVYHQPVFTPIPNINPFQPPYVVTCSTEDKSVCQGPGTFVQPDPGQVF